MDTAPAKRSLTSIFNPSRLFAYGLSVGLILVGLQVILLYSIQDEWAKQAVNDFLPAVASSLAAVSLAYGAYWTAKKRPQLHQAWIFLAAGGFFWAAGDLIYAVLEVIIKQSAFPSIADAFYLLMFPAFLVGILLFPGKNQAQAENLQLILDVSIVMIATGLLFWSLLIGPVLDSSHANLLSSVVSIAYPVGDFILLWALAILVFRSVPDQPDPPLVFLMVGFLVTIVMDIIYSNNVITATLGGSDVINTLFTVSSIGLMLAGLNQAQIFSPQTSQGKPAHLYLSKTLRRLRIGLPYVWLVCAYLALLIVRFLPSVLSSTATLIWVGIIIALVIYRQIIMIQENYRLAKRMSVSNAMLEQRVAERTRALSRANQELLHEMAERQRVEQTLREREAKLSQFALHDTLTGLPNRSLLLEHLDLAMKRMRREPGYHFAIFFLDIDGFKVINDSLGHLAGDQLLVQVSQRLRGCVREVDTVARLGGDEFVVMVNGHRENEDAIRAVERVQEALRAHFDLSGNRVFLTASIGVVYANLDYQQPADILRDADLAMYEAKRQGKARYAVFIPELHARAVDRMVIENDLRHAIDHDELIVHYQPVISLETGQITGFEALLRWRNPEHDLVPPSQFIPIAENSGLIVPITEWILREACRQARRWQDQFPCNPPLTVSVNLSGRLFAQPVFPYMVENILAETGLSPRSLILEITESVIAEDAEAVARILNHWRKMGLRTHMDDFGTGYSSLSCLHQFPIDALKIDRVFVSRINPQGENTEVIRTIVALARQMKMEVIAEGIETDIQFNYLKEVGCQSGQGYFISEPLPSEEIVNLLAQHTLTARVASAVA